MRGRLALLVDGWVAQRHLQVRIGLDRAAEAEDLLFDPVEPACFSADISNRLCPPRPWP